MPIVRIPLTQQIESRTASFGKDSYTANGMFETRSKKKEFVKRPGLTKINLSPALTPLDVAQGIYSFKGNLWAILANNVYKIVGLVPSVVGTTSGATVPVRFALMGQSHYMVWHNNTNFYYVTDVSDTPVRVFTGAVISYNIVDTGSGYTSLPTATVLGGGGSSATATVGLGITDALVVAAGSGYAINDVLTVSGGTSTASAKLLVTGVDASGAILPDGYGLYNAGIYSALPSNAVATTALGAGTGATFNLTWGVSSVTQNAAGSGYTSTPTVIISGALNASVTANVSFFPDQSLVTGVVYLDGYIFVMTTTGRIYNSAIENPAVWNPLDFVSTESEPDDGVAIAKHFNYLVAFGQWSTEFYSDNANPTGSPISRNAGARLEIGCANGDSVQQLEQSLIFMGQTKELGKSVYILEGLSPTRVSNVYIEKYLNADTGNNLSSFVLKLSGHTLYVLNLFNSNITLVYDLNEKEWYRWTSYVSGSENYFLPSFFASHGGLYYVLGRLNGTLYTLSDAVYQDNGVPIYYRSVFDISDSGTTKRKFYGRAEVVGDKVAATGYISHSHNDYSTFSIPREVNLMHDRPQLNQLGADRRRIWQFLCTDNVPLRLEALEIDFDIGGMEGEGG